eukprot:TRINITY_DN7192_c0_g1_i2.p1 TRINITY_DN7192_c0_g1~~TRINITY_DN7192_c0_g1_i2.p1  ORF type:complete len:109 (+),score=7.43 TRINITY_DN7192_c0_g1_i2:367-693(+)
MMYSVFCFLLASFLVVSSALPTGYYATSAVGRPQARAECAKVGGTLAAITLSNYHTFPEDVGAFWVDSWNGDNFGSKDGLAYSPPASFSASVTDSRGLPLFIPALCKV